MGRWGEKGATLIETVLAVTLFLIMIAAVVPLLTISQRGFATAEAHEAIKTSGETTLNQISHKVVECKRLFENTSADAPFLSRVQHSSSPVALAGSQLAIKEENGGITPSTGSFVAAGVGNSLFFANVDAPKDLSVLDSGGSTDSVRIDTYIFNYYYLAVDSSSYIGGSPRLMLWEWHSKAYPDYNEIMAVVDGTERSNVVKALFASGYADAWDPSTGTVTSAFYDLSSAGTLSVNSALMIKEGTSRPMITTLPAMSGFHCGVCPNTSSLVTDQTVPEFATANGSFPSGFEIVTVGPTSARQILIRLVLVAQGNFPRTISHDQVVVATAHDLW